MDNHSYRGTNHYQSNINVQEKYRKVNLLANYDIGQSCILLSSKYPYDRKKDGN